MNGNIKTSDGVKIAVFDPNPSGKETVFLVHGWPLSHKIFEYQEHLLLCQDYRIITIDLRGFGNSEMPAEGYCYDRMARDVYEVVRQLGIKSFVLGGFSMGGAIVLRYMRLFRGYGVKKLMLFAAAAPCWTRREGFPYGMTKEMVNKQIRQIEEDRPQYVHTFTHQQLLATSHSESVKNWFEDIALSATLHGTVKAAISLRDEDGREDLNAVRVPTAIFQGNRDVIVPQELTMYQYHYIQGAVLYQLCNSGHGVMYDELERFNDYMMEFLTYDNAMS